MSAKAAVKAETAAQKRALNAAFALYKRVFSPLLHALSLAGPQGCRYQPTCSEYATLALSEHGLLRGACMALWRILRCNPLSAGGWDPVPAAHHRFSSPRKPTSRGTGTIEESGAHTPSSRPDRD